MKHDVNAGRKASAGSTNGSGKGSASVGFTNGAAKGFTNGSGKGMTNGLGSGFVNGSGRGSGFTNGAGNGFTNGAGRGMTNGLTNGLVSGGFTNGLGGTGHFDCQGAVHPKKLSVIIVVILVIMLPISLILLADSQNVPGQMVSVDGKFKDWNKMTKYADTAMCADTPLDITEFAVAFDKTDFFAFVQTQGNMLSRAAIDRYFAFIDADGSTATGYLAFGLGAEYLVEANGYNGGSWQVASSKFYGTDQHNWSAFSSVGSGHAESKDAEMELKASLDTELEVGGALRVRFASMTGSAMADVCAPIVDGENGALVISQTPQDVAGIVATNSLLSLQVRAVGKDVVANSLTISSQGVAATTQVGFTAGTIAVNTAQTVTVTGDVAALSNGTLVKASVSTVLVTPATYNVNGNGLVAYANAAPAAITIDGAFADWTAITKTSDPASDATNPNIDIIENAAAAQSNSFFAYVKFNGAGKAMAGMAVPSARVASTGGGGGGGGTIVLPRVSGEDVTRIYVDSKAGGSNIGGIQADYVIELRGRNGLILLKQVYTHPSQSLAGTASAETGESALETGVPFALIGSPSGPVSMFVETTDWEQKVDSATSIQTMPLIMTKRGMLDSSASGNASAIWHFDEGSGLYANDASGNGNTGTLVNSPSWTANGVTHGAIDFDGINDYVNCGAGAGLNPTAAVTIEAWVKMDTRPSVAGRIFHIAGRSGVGTDLDLIAMNNDRFRFYVAAGQSAESTTVIQVGVWYHVVGTYAANNHVSIFVNGTLEQNIPIVVARSGNPNAFTIGTSAIWGSRWFDGIIDEVSVWSRSLSSEEILNRYIALTQSTVVINEVMFDSTSGDDWVEIHNPTLVNYDISGWKLIDGSDAIIYTYPASTTLGAGAYSVQTVAAATLGNTDALALVEAGGTMRDYLAWGAIPTGDNYTKAVDSGNWYSGTNISTSGFIQGNTIGRDRNSTDNNQVADWEITCGVHANSPTPTAVNDTPEFPTIAIPIIFCALPFVVFRARKRKH